MLQQKNVCYRATHVHLCVIKILQVTQWTMNSQQAAKWQTILWFGNCNIKTATIIVAMFYSLFRGGFLMKFEKIQIFLHKTKFYIWIKSWVVACLVCFMNHLLQFCRKCITKKAPFRGTGNMPAKAPLSYEEHISSRALLVLHFSAAYQLNC